MWLSTLLRPRVARTLWSGISLIVGTAARRALERLGVNNAALYWPNDLQAGNKKIGGILGEVRGQAERSWIAMGIGINIDFYAGGEPPPPDVAQRATSMVACGAPSATSPRDVAEAILETLWPLYEQFQDGTSIPELVDTDLAHVGEHVEVRVGSGNERSGIVRGLGARGELLIEPTGGELPQSLSAVDGVVALTGGEVVYGNKSSAER